MAKGGMTTRGVEERPKSQREEEKWISCDGDGREHFSWIYSPLAESHIHIAGAAVGLALTQISIHLHV